MIEPVRLFISPLSVDVSSARTEVFVRTFESGWETAGPVILDFSQCRFMSSVGIAMLAMLKLDRDRRGRVTSIDWTTVPGPVTKQLARRGFSELFGARPYPWTGSTIPLLHQPTTNPRALVSFIDDHVIPRFNMSEPLARETRRSFCEVFNNVFQHSESPIGGVAVGRFYPRARRFQLCVADLGIGLVKR